jgi:glycosyltransferase involved in cell wall biosynthesis
MAEANTKVLHIVNKHALGGGIGTVMDYLMEGINGSPGFQADQLNTDYDEELHKPKSSSLIQIGKEPVEIGTDASELEKMLGSYDVIHVHSIPHYGILESLYALKKKGSKIKIVDTVHSSLKVEFLSQLNATSAFPEGTPEKEDYKRLKALYDDNILNDPYKYQFNFWGSAISRQEKIMSLSDVVQHMTENYKNQILNEFSAQDSEEKHLVLPHGVKTVDETEPRPKKKRIMYVGRFSREKGIEEFIDSIPKIFEKHPDAEIKLLGGDKSGYWVKHYNQKVKEKLDEYFKDKPGHNSSDYFSRVQFTGWVSDKNELMKHYRWTDYVIVPSTAESFSLAAAEALMHKRIPILTKTKAMEELYISKGIAFGIDEDKRTGQGIADVVNKILEGNASAEQDEMAEKGRKYVVDNYSFDTMIKKQVEIYKGILNPKTEK